MSTHPSLQLSVFDSFEDRHHDVRISRSATIAAAVWRWPALRFGSVTLYKLLRKVHDLAAALPAEMASNTDALGCGIATVALALEEVQKILQIYRPIVHDGSPSSRSRLNFSKADHD